MHACSENLKPSDLEALALDLVHAAPRARDQEESNCTAQPAEELHQPFLPKECVLRGTWDDLCQTLVKERLNYVM